MSSHTRFGVTRAPQGEAIYVLAPLKPLRG